MSPAEPSDESAPTRAQPTAFERWEATERAAQSAAEEAAAAQQELLQAREAARAEGHAAGLEAGRAEVAEECSRIRDVADSYVNAVDSLDFRLADMVLDLALDIARQVIVGELAAHPERILVVVRLALNQMAESTREARLLLHPDDAALLRPHLEQIIDRSRLRIVEDARIVRGGCLVETAQGDLDATVQARWRQVVQALGSNQGWLE